MSRHWVDWHAEYDDPQSSLAQRLLVVRQCIREALDCIVKEQAVNPLRAISLCAGDGRDLLPVLADRTESSAVQARLVEIDPDLAYRAELLAQLNKLSGVEIVCGDAATTTAYAGIAPAHLVLVCGVFGNITAADGRRTVAALRRLTAPSGYVVWTRGRGSPTSDPSEDVRRWFGQEGFTESSFTAPRTAKFRVGMHQLSPTSARAYRPDVRMFAFVDD